jgi:RNA polymerase sigma-70 factor (ECF subfamily)
MSTADQPSSPEPDPAKTEYWERRAFEKQLINVIPDLRAIARMMTRDSASADDLVQDTVIRALRAFRRFEPGSNMKAWAFRIMHNCHINLIRRQRLFTVGDLIDDWQQSLPAQEDSVELREVLRAVDRLVPAHREVIMLVRAGGISYNDAAAIMSCKLGTVKSRLNRADAALRQALGAEYAASTANQDSDIERFAVSDSTA